MEDLSKYPPMYKDLIAKATGPIAEQLKVPEDAARLAAYLVCEVIRKDWAGIFQYVSKGCAYDLTRRDREMYEKFNGRNYKELAKEYGISERQVYTRLDMIREDEFARRQPSLFPE
jgi:Mor family transcriptional regulator